MKNTEDAESSTNDIIKCSKILVHQCVDDEISISIKKKSNKSDCIYYALNGDNKIIAHAMVSENKVWTSELRSHVLFLDSAYIYNVFVSKKYRGNKLQAKLMKVIEGDYDCVHVMSSSKNRASISNITMLGYSEVCFLNCLVVLGIKRLYSSGYERVKY